jgi:predicted N-acyltransferase
LEGYFHSSYAVVTSISSSGEILHEKQTFVFIEQFYAGCRDFAATLVAEKKKRKKEEKKKQI